MAKVYTRQEVNRRKVGFQIFAGIYDFIAIIIGVLVIIGCILLLVALINWVVRDGTQSFASLWNIFQSAIIIPK